MTIRVAIVDDQALMRDGFTMILDAQPDIDVVGDAENGRAGVELCQRTRPDVVLMDIRMPVLDGLEATRIITADADIPTKVLVLTTFDLDEYVYAASARRCQRLPAEGHARQGAGGGGPRRRPG